MRTTELYKILFLSTVVLLFESYLLCNESFQERKEVKFPLTEWVYKEAAHKYKTCIEHVS